MNILGTFLVRTAVYAALLTGGIALLIHTVSAVMQGEIVVYSWSALLLFSFAVFLWIIPVQIIDWLKLIKVQQRMKRIIFPYLVTLIQVMLFAMYTAALSSTIQDITFSALGLSIIVMAVASGARLLYTMMLRSIRKYKQPRVRVTAE
ncbi:hypothetical protein [Alkalicoccus saliphilus]|uniref:Uncharacterized protein n=1 Tax=Alkalicoccus saliphilus TaxID=200989 RepID=A0A2T4U792_9BACI|nr:hypothetical protein [Alkalicoccus saliphilus]PTL39225.1 hypothetical protein C6Y45_07490 [Alkalicoccus saliphilus]